MQDEYIVVHAIERRTIRVEFREPQDQRNVHDVNDRRVYIVEMRAGKEKPIDGLDRTYATLEMALSAYLAHTGPQVAPAPLPRDPQR